MSDTVQDSAAAAQASADAAAADAAAAADTAAAAGSTATPPAQPVVPESYALTLPDGTLLSPQAVERVTATAKALGLTDDAKAQQLVALAHAEAAEVAAVLEAANKPGGTLYEQRTKQFAAEALAAFDLGNGSQDVLTAKVVEAQLELAKAPPAIRELLDTSGYGSHPDVLRWLLALHRRTAEKPLAQPSGTPPIPAREPLEKRMYSDLDAQLQKAGVK